MKRGSICSLIAVFGMLQGIHAQYQRRQLATVSPADSAAAISSFKNARGGTGPFFQYRVTDVILVGKQSTTQDTMSLSVTDAGESRSDMGVMGQQVSFVGRVPGKYSVTLDQQARTYVLNVIDTAAINNPNITYQVTKVGNETVGGYNCVHARLIQTMAHSQAFTMDIYTSKDVPGYSTLKGMMSMANVTPAMYQALERAGCGGIFVKMTMQTKQMNMDMILITATRKTFPAAIFQIPSGYNQAVRYRYGR